MAIGWRQAITPVYEAACRTDRGRLARIIDSLHGSAGYFGTNACRGCSGTQIVSMWTNEYGLDLTALARLLETRPHLSQGGYTYMQGDLLAAFTRGTIDIPPQWSNFYPDCASEADCTANRRYADDP